MTLPETSRILSCRVGRRGPGSDESISARSLSGATLRHSGAHHGGHAAVPVNDRFT